MPQQQQRDSRRYDLHELIELVQQGCAPELAVRILSPLDDDADD